MRPFAPFAPLAALALASTLLAGCWEGPGVERVRWAVEEQLPGARFDRGVHVRLGRLSTGFVRWVTGKAMDEGEPAREMIGAVERVQVAVYEAHGVPPLEDVALPRSLDHLLDEHGWQMLVEAREPSEIVWVLVRQDEETIRHLYLVALGVDELAVVRLEGELTRAFAAALADRPGEAKDELLAL